MKKLILLSLMAVLLAACGTHRHDMEFDSGQEALPATARYHVEPAANESGFTFEKNEDFDMESAMHTALVTRLKEENLYAEPSEQAFSIKPTVTKYEPGNAFGRWLMPGVGSTRIEVSSAVSTPEGSVIGKVETRNTIDAGGALTIGAWKSIFSDAAEEIVTELKECMGLQAEKKAKTKSE